MTSKSRLGKGLGALFPALPGESRTAHAEQQQLGVDVESKETTANKKAPQEKAAAAPEKVESHKSGTEQHSESTAPVRLGEIKRKTIPAMKDSIPAVHKSTTVEKPKSGKRVAMPGISDMAHPSDMFFGATAQGTSDSKKTQPAQRSESTKASGKEKDNKETPKLKPVEGGYLLDIPVSSIVPNAQQPRSVFDEEELNELAASIKEVGVLQPIVVRKRPQSQIEAARREAAAKPAEPHNMFDGRMDSMYELIMGERRWRASQIAGLKTIPAIVKTTADDDMLRDALLENLHRVALNPLEEAAAYQQMIEEFGLTQVQLSKSVSKSRPQIANTLRLLNLPAAVQKKVASGLLSAGHARALLGLPTEADMEQLATRIIAEGLSVRSTEEIVALKNAESNVPKKVRPTKNNPWAGSPIVNNLENHFDTKVSIKGTQKHGRIEIVFSSPEDMERILSMLIPTAVEGAAAKWV